jgi:hypothetical protein
MNHQNIPVAEAADSAVAVHADNVCSQRTDAVSGFHSLVALRSFQSGELVTSFRAANVRTSPTYLTVQVGEDQHIELWPAQLQFTNHSCRPNCHIDTRAFEFVAVRDIAVGDELTFFYPSTEWHMQQPFTCACGAPECVGTVSGADAMPADVMNRYRLSDFIRQKLDGRAS